MALRPLYMALGQLYMAAQHYHMTTFSTSSGYTQHKWYCRNDL